MQTGHVLSSSVAAQPWLRSKTYKDMFIWKGIPMQVLFMAE
ncbi:hypothetical protein OHAE_1746 [Ochrobactrum soli]|uniref:Uncharacterized protein n=1 Tax=Ochrobactrum soli TaxID=2448455 RepID=A0A2P9HP90_9HYPH|nr:hypothetical protein OHAE_1746 [[Ochrobactrum] soli]